MKSSLHKKRLRIFSKMCVYLLVSCFMGTAFAKNGKDPSKDKTKKVAFTTVQIPKTISYQGLLTDGSGNVKGDGDYTFTFTLYNAVESGTKLWTETKQLAVENGLFSTQLGDTNPFETAVKFDRPYWLGISVEAGDELSPRIPLTTSPYSFTALRADTATHVAPNFGEQDVVTTGKVTAGSFSGEGSGLSRVSAEKLQGKAVSGSAPEDGQVLKWNGSAWQPSTDNTGLSGTISITSGGTGATTASGARSNLGLKVMATADSVNDVNVSSNAAISGKKISPNFGEQDVVTNKSFKYSTPKKRYFVVMPHEFHTIYTDHEEMPIQFLYIVGKMEESGDSDVGFGYILGPGMVAAPVRIPDHAKILSVELVYHDEHPDIDLNISLKRRRYDKIIGTSETIANFTSTGASATRAMGLKASASILIANTTVDNSSYGYYILFKNNMSFDVDAVESARQKETSGMDIYDYDKVGLGGLRITYEVDTLD